MHCREKGLFPPNDPLLNELASTPGLFPFEKHLSGENSCCQPLPKGGWVTGDAAAGKLDLRMFYKASYGSRGRVEVESAALRKGLGCHLAELVSIS